jgi:hypothetical protein
MAACKYHPERPGVGVCMRCRSVVCADCTTRLDGINHCHACLKRLAAPEERRAGGAGAALGALLLLGAAWLVFFGLGWAFEGRWAP